MEWNMEMLQSKQTPPFLIIPTKANILTLQETLLPKRKNQHTKQLKCHFFQIFHVDLKKRKKLP